MTMNEFLEDVDRPRGGKWAKLTAKGDKLVGTLLDVQVRERTDPEGNVVLTRGTQKPRKIYRVTVEVTPEDGDDDGLRIFDANESAQRAIQDAYKKVGTRELIGGQFAIAIAEDAPNSMSQAQYVAKFTPPAPTKTVELDDLI